MRGHSPHQYRKSCRYWDDLMQKRPWLHGEIAPRPGGLWPSLRAETSQRQSGRAGCLVPCKPHPSLRCPALRQCGNAKWSGRSFALKKDLTLPTLLETPVNDSNFFRVYLPGEIAQTFLLEVSLYSPGGFSCSRF